MLDLNLLMPAFGGESLRGTEAFLKYAEEHPSDVRRVVLSTGERVFYLFLPGYRVVLTFDRPNSVVHVWRVFRTGST